jgi:biotin synthase
MCYAIPGKVYSLEGKYVAVDYFGEKKKAINEFEDLRKGDYIYAQGGYVIKIIPADEAHSILSTWKEVFFELQETDLRLSRLDLEEKGISKDVSRILDRAAEGLKVKEKDLLKLLDLENKDELELLYKTANFIRQKHLKNSCCVHGIIEFSNYCTQACHYCGISSLNKKISRYRMTKEEIIDTARTAIEKYGFQALVLQGGEDPHYSIDDLCGIVREIKKRFSVLIFVSFGETGTDGLKKLYDAGARGLLMRFETSDPELYRKIHPGRELETRIEHLEKAFKLGYLIITGGLIGLPGQTKESILKDIFLAKKLNTEMYTFGPFIPHPKTPMGSVSAPLTDGILKALAVARIVDPENAKIVVTTGFETLDKQARQLGLMAGANSVMLNVTPEAYRKHYSIYPNRAHMDEHIQKQIDDTIKILRDLGRAPTDLSVTTQ